jgi:hypothetical protein
MGLCSVLRAREWGLCLEREGVKERQKAGVRGREDRCRSGVGDGRSGIKRCCDEGRACGSCDEIVEMRMCKGARGDVLDEKEEWCLYVL